jgi:hypothetical protein
MADITKCSGDGCPKKETCFRFTAEADPRWQSMFVQPPLEDGICEMYWGVDAKYIWNELNDIDNGN